MMQICNWGVLEFLLDFELVVLFFILKEYGSGVKNTW